MGLTHYLDSQLETRDKWAILELFHAIELLLKERLHQDDPTLIYRNVDKPVTNDSKTVGSEEALERLVDIGVEMPHEYVAILRDLRRQRNRIEHHRFVPDSSHRRVLGEALKFIGYFLEDELGEQLEDHLPKELFHEAKELMVDYDVLGTSSRGGDGRRARPLRSQGAKPPRHRDVPGVRQSNGPDRGR